MASPTTAIQKDRPISTLFATLFRHIYSMPRQCSDRLRKRRRAPRQTMDSDTPTPASPAMQTNLQYRQENCAETIRLDRNTIRSPHDTDRHDRSILHDIPRRCRYYIHGEFI